MRSETDVKPALRRAAARIEVPPPPVARIARRGRRRSRRGALGAAASVLALLVGSWGVGTWAMRPEPDVRAVPPPGTRPAADPGEPELRFRSATRTSEEAAVSDDLFVDAEAATQGSPDTGASQGPPETDAPDPGAPPLQAGEGIVKTAHLKVRIERGAFQEIYTRAQRLAAARGGFVAESTTGGERARRGELVIRVPAAEFEETLADLKGLGLVERETVKGEDVTAVFVDLRARLRNWRSQERAVRGLMDEATSIDQTLRLQRELQEVRLKIERIKGELLVLRDRADLGTITMAMREKGAGPAAPPEEPSILGKAWDAAMGGALDVIGTMVVGAGYLFPILAVLLLAWGAFRLARPRARA